MSVLRRGDEHADLILKSHHFCAHCGYGPSSADLSNQPGPFVFWMGLDGFTGKTEGVDLVFHPACALEWAAHLTADAIEARTMMHH